MNPSDRADLFLLPLDPGAVLGRAFEDYSRFVPLDAKLGAAAEWLQGQLNGYSAGGCPGARRTEMDARVKGWWLVGVVGHGGGCAGGRATVAAATTTVTLISVMKEGSLSTVAK